METPKSFSDFVRRQSILLKKDCTRSTHPMVIGHGKTIVFYCIVSIHLYSASRSAHQSEALQLTSIDRWCRCSSIAEKLCAKNLLKVPTQ